MANINPQYETIAKQFVDFYYQTFDADRAKLIDLYRPESMLTFESSSVQGAQAIVEKLSSLPFQKVAHKVGTLDSQPNPTGGAIILVTGQLLVDEEQNPMNYTQTFQLFPDDKGSFFIYNDVFKLVYG
ncbi:Nuclear transport factor 2 [Zalerion maritima]|uniref:Nuclear transport factor 2 n=1 Tax=Zalerion maritima TaxID=339359 RepID=A0AAD5WRR3_9PEZI|nr:Nuclear transport factor 2 [Zalerion maritima]